MEKLAEVVAPAIAIKLAIAKMRPSAEKKLKPRGLEWADVQPALEQIDTLEHIQAAAADPIKFLETVESTLAWPIASAP